MNKTIYHVEIEFIEPVLGAQARKDIMTEHAPHPEMIEADELAALADEVEQSTTTFHKVDGKPVLFNYQVKGFLKNAAKVLNGLKTCNVKALRSKVEDHVFVMPRIIPLQLPEGTEIDYLERPGSFNTPLGPRVALLRSETVPVGTKISFTIEVLDGSPISRDILVDLLSYGENIGIGQWRNSGKGSFTFTIV